ncbi:glycoside hydrolase family 105 protein [Paenibacillus yanchengensis]|uniref:Glycoside hydrolase family 105 protein n=1 Tax=Paenibacillus yanchengensis TaxID=2035833 RepID=A0ABW4YRF4_9BACL
MKMQWAEKTAQTMMERTPLLHVGKAYNGNWSYDYGVVLKGFEQLWLTTGEQHYLQYIKDNLDAFVMDDGTIRTYHQADYNIDHLNTGKLLFLLYDVTGDEKYKQAATQLRKQLHEHPRTSEGAFWHKKRYPYQIWLDGLYMGAPFYLQYLITFEPENNLEDVTKQFIICERHLKDEKTGLLYHAWDEKRVQPWCDPQTGHSPHFWARALGWFVMAVVDVLALLPKDHMHYPELQRILVDTLTVLRNYQDEKSGVWYQIVDAAERKGNYLEASASSMITYAIARGLQLGLLPADWSETLNKAYTGIIEEFILLTNNGWVNVNKTCQVAGLGGPSQRDGSYAYYLSEPIITNDQKGVGAFLLASTAYEQVQKVGGVASK